MSAGVAASSHTDSGVSAGQFGLLLSQMADHPGESVFIFAANDITKLSPDFTRAERRDAIFLFCIHPYAAEKQAIWKIHPSYFSLDYDLRHPRDYDWTEAEIRACC